MIIVFWTLAVVLAFAILLAAQMRVLVSIVLRRALAARTQFLSVSRQRLDNRVQLILSLGGGFDDEGIAAPASTTRP